MDICRVMGVDEDTISAVFFGDDVDTVLNTAEEAVAIYRGYQAYGLDVNPSKFWISSQRDEFLRLVVEDGRRVGYPARLVTSMLYRKPGAFDNTDADLPAMMDQWIKAVSRGAPVAHVEKQLFLELSKLFHISLSDAADLARTPLPLGGGGWPFGVSNNMITVDREQRNYAKITGGSFPLFNSFGINPEDSLSLANHYLASMLPTRLYQVKRLGAMNRQILASAMSTIPSDLRVRSYYMEFKNPLVSPDYIKPPGMFRDLHLIYYLANKIPLKHLLFNYTLFLDRDWETYPEV